MAQKLVKEKYVTYIWLSLLYLALSSILLQPNIIIVEYSSMKDTRKH